MIPLFSSFFLDIEYNHNNKTNNNLKCESLGYLRKKVQRKVINVDVTKASLTQAIKKFKYFNVFSFLLDFFSCLQWKDYCLYTSCQKQKLFTD